MAVNAAHYGALSSAQGHVSVTWTVTPDKMLHLRWQESGGPPVTPPLRKGFGLRLIEHGLGREICGAVLLDFQPAGLVCEWKMALP